MSRKIMTIGKRSRTAPTDAVVAKAWDNECRAPCGSEATEVYVREPLTVVATPNE